MISGVSGTTIGCSAISEKSTFSDSAAACIWDLFLLRKLARPSVSEFAIDQHIRFDRADHPGSGMVRVEAPTPVADYATRIPRHRHVDLPYREGIPS